MRKEKEGISNGSRETTGCLGEGLRGKLESLKRGGKTIYRPNKHNFRRIPDFDACSPNRAICRGRKQYNARLCPARIIARDDDGVDDNGGESFGLSTRGVIGDFGRDGQNAFGVYSAENPGESANHTLRKISIG